MGAKDHAETNFKKTVPVWDVATRLFHWALVSLIVLAYFTNKFAGTIGFQWHKITGYAILTLIVFRVLWGIAGSSTSRFASFFRPFSAPGYLVSLARGKSRHYLGHNPAGAMMVMTLLLVVAAQAISGLFTADDVDMMLFSGPFASKVAESNVEMFGRFHRIGFYLILALAVVHILVNITYALFRRDGMIKAMVTGHKKAGDYHDAPEARFSSQFAALICFLISVAVVFGGVYLWGDAPFL